jgi:hypothetical protein
MIGNFVLRISASRSLTPKDRGTRNRRTARSIMVLAARFCLAAILIVGFQASLAHAQLTQLYAFQYNAGTASNWPDGRSPYAELIQGADGNSKQFLWRLWVRIVFPRWCEPTCGPHGLFRRLLVWHNPAGRRV